MQDDVDNLENDNVEADLLEIGAEIQIPGPGT
jgi:hypothetical protein